jgi:NADH-quinone oxidoreductase subunit N
MDNDAIILALYTSLPEITVLTAACALLMLDLLWRQQRVQTIGYLSAGVIVIAAIETLLIAGQAEPVYNGMFVLDSFAIFFKMLFYLIALLCVLLSVGFIKQEQIEHSEYHVLLLFALCGLMILASSIDLIIIYVGLELMALSVYLLTGFNRRNRFSNEASLKYVILSALSSSILLYGMSLIYGLTGSTNIEVIAVVMGQQETIDPLLILSVVFMIAGFAFKVAAVPFHMWVPDVYQGAPTPITAFMSVGPKAVGFAILLRIFLQGLMPVVDVWQILLIVIAVATMAVGSIVALVQDDIKRMLAYSSIAHVGFAMLGLVAGGDNGTASVMLYLLIYSFMNLGIFAVVITMRQGNVLGERIEDYTGLAKPHPVLALLMLIFLFSLAGIPPTAGFFAKFYIFVALIEQEFVSLAVIAVLFSVVSAFFYIRIVMLMYMRPPAESFGIQMTVPLQIVLGVTGVAVVVIGIVPAWFLGLAQAAIFQ